MMTEHRPSLDLDIPAPIRSNHLYYGDNLTIMRSLLSSSVDLIYLDPPFNSQRNYNLIYSKLTGQPVPEQEEAFCDAWEMDPEKEEMVRRMPIVFREYGADDDLIQFWRAWIDALRHTQPRLLAYLVYMSYRLFEMRRILKSTGSIYLHCDPTASHYIKVIMDGIFGHNNFRNEIVWQRTGAHSDARRWGRVTDNLLFYTKSDKWTWHQEYVPYSTEYVAERYKYQDDDGRRYWRNTMTAAGPGPARTFRGETLEPPAGTHWRFSQTEIERMEAENRIYYSPSGKPYVKSYLDERKGRPVQNVWTDITMTKSGAERLGYPTQKPIALLKRIIGASSNPGDVVFDPFAGCGTAVYAAHTLGRKWIGCDIAILSVKLVRDVLLKRYGLKEGEHYQISGVPVSVEGAQDLMDRDPHQFQHWAVELAGGFATVKRSGDRGIDGRVHFETKDGLRNMVLSVKGGKLTPAFMRELRGTMEREPDSEIGGLICLQQPTKGMERDVADAGVWTYQGRDYHRLQIRTVAELLDGRAFDTPSRVQTLDWTRQVPLPI
jgi:DNA modification methylase